MSFRPKSASIVFYVSDILRTEAFCNETMGRALRREEGAESFWLQRHLENGLDLTLFQMAAVRGNANARICRSTDKSTPLTASNREDCAAA